MAKRRKKKQGKGIVPALLVLAAVIAALFFGKDALLGGLTNNPAAPVSGGEVQFHFIDVGQGDAALIRTEAGDNLIDAGTNSSEDELKAYLDSMGVKNLEYAVFTHPHEDHIGGADMVLSTYNVKRVVLPDATATSKTYERMMDAIEAEKCEVIEATPDYVFNVGEVKCTILAPISTDTWGVKESSASEEDVPEWGNREERGINMEISTAAANLIGGADAVILRHPAAVAAVKKFIAELV